MKTFLWLVLFPPVGIYLLLKGKKNSTEEHASDQPVLETSKVKTEKTKKEKKPKPSSNPKNLSKSDRKLLTKEETRKREAEGKSVTKGKSVLSPKLFMRYKELATQTEKYRKVLRFRRDAGMFSEGCWKTHYGRVDLENSTKYGFLGEILKTDPLVKNEGKGDKFCSPFGWTTDFEIEFDKLKKSLEVGMFDDPIYEGFFSPISLDTLLTKHSEELEELFVSETQAKYEYIVRLVGSHDFSHIDSSSFEKIIRRFPNIDAFMKASITKISEIEGISRATATTVKETVEDIYYS